MLRVQIFEVNGLRSGSATPQRLDPLGDFAPTSMAAGKPGTLPTA
jgi:hypothetical protein